MKDFGSMIRELIKVQVVPKLGVYTYNNGDKYIGDWKEDQKEGKGKI